MLGKKDTRKTLLIAKEFYFVTALRCQYKPIAYQFAIVKTGRAEMAVYI
jgi:hypothetical protein